MRIKQIQWFTTVDNIKIGIVMGIDDVTGERKAYIGTGLGIDEAADTIDIAQLGIKIHPEVIKNIHDFFSSKGEI